MNVDIWLPELFQVVLYHAGKGYFDVGPVGYSPNSSNGHGEPLLLWSLDEHPHGPLSTTSFRAAKRQPIPWSDFPFFPLACRSDGRLMDVLSNRPLACKQHRKNSSVCEDYLVAMFDERREAFRSICTMNMVCRQWKAWLTPHWRAYYLEFEKLVWFLQLSSDRLHGFCPDHIREMSIAYFRSGVTFETYAAMERVLPSEYCRLASTHLCWNSASIELDHGHENPCDTQLRKERISNSSLYLVLDLETDTELLLCGENVDVSRHLLVSNVIFHPKVIGKYRPLAPPMEVYRAESQRKKDLLAHYNELDTKVRKQMLRVYTLMKQQDVFKELKS